MKFNSQVCTTKEQSRRLLDLGLKPETADMHHYQYIAGGRWNVEARLSIAGYNNRLVPAWSLHRLICMCEVTTLLPVDNSSSAYDHIIDVIERFINEGYFNKEYLKQ